MNMLKILAFLRHKTANAIELYHSRMIPNRQETNLAREGT